VKELGPVKSKSIENIIEEVLSPSFKDVGWLSVDKVLSEAKREDLAVRLNNLLVDDGMKHWLYGSSLDFKDMQPGQCIIYSVAHITDTSQQHMAISYLLSDVCAWTWKLSGTGKAKAVVVIDECEGLLPPYPKNPITKQHLMALAKKGRAFGVGLILATQNSKDIDYKVLSNCNTWLIGRLKTEIDRSRVLEGVNSSYHKDTAKALNSLNKREFIKIHGATTTKWISPDVSSKLTGPYTSEELRVLYKIPAEVPNKSIVSYLKRTFGL
jgi:hypothetical protein